MVKTPTLQIKVKSFSFCILISFFLGGCGPQDATTQAQQYIQKSDAYYLKAIAQYTQLIARGKSLDSLRFQLGKLYFDHGAFSEAVKEFNKIKGLDAAVKYSALAQYKLGNFTDALEVFSKHELGDDQYRYYHGLTCEKLNLFDRALALYQKIKGPDFAGLAQERIGSIEKQAGTAHIKNISPSTYAIIKNAPPQEKYPQAGALILWCDEKTEVAADNTEVSTLHYIVKILNERGKEDFSETHLDYDSTYEKVTLTYARTIKPDGIVAEVGARHIRDVSKYLNFPLYSNARVYIISFPEITEGAVIEYEAKIYRNELINKKDFVLSYSLQANEPIISADFSLAVATNKEVQFKNINEPYNSFNARLTPAVRKENGRIIYSWQFKDIPQIIPEPNMPPSVEINPGILMSTFSSWDEIYQWWWTLAKDKIAADEAIKDKVKELTAGCSRQEDKVKAIYDFCARKIRYVAVEYGQAGYEPHKAEDIFRNKYGDCKDQAILLVTMLKNAGFTAWPVLIPTKDCYNLQKEFPSMLFDHCIAAVEMQGKLIFMDPTAETCPFRDLPSGDQDRQVLVIKDAGYSIEATPLFPSSVNKAQYVLQATINDNESIDVQKSVVSSGVYNQGQRHWLLYTPPELIEQALTEKIQDVSIGATLLGYQLSSLDTLDDSVTLTYSFKGPEYLTAAGHLRLMPQLTGVDASLVAKAARKYPLDFGILDMKETDITIVLPAAMRVNYLPPPVEEDSPWIKCSVAYTQKGRAIEFRQRMELKKRVIPVEAYVDFKKFFEGLAKKIKQRIVLEKIK